MKVTVLYNGIPHEVELAKVSYVGALMDRAVAHFSPPDSVKRKHLAFFAADGSELQPNRTLAASGVKDGDTVLLRPTVIP